MYSNKFFLLSIIIDYIVYKLEYTYIIAKNVRKFKSTSIYLIVNKKKLF